MSRLESTTSLYGNRQLSSAVGVQPCWICCYCCYKFVHNFEMFPTKSPPERMAYKIFKTATCILYKFFAYACLTAACLFTLCKKILSVNKKCTHFPQRTRRGGATAGGLSSSSSSSGCCRLCSRLSKCWNVLANVCLCFA